MNKKSDHFLLKDVENGLKISNKHAGTRLIKGICDLWHQKQLCDIVIKCNGEEIQAHKTILAIYSDYFRAMFTAGFEESSQQQSVVTLDEAIPEALKLIIDYMYTGNITVSKEGVQDVVVLADLLQMSDLKKICCIYMEILLDVSNCLGVWDFSEKYSCSELTIKSVMLLKQRFLTVCQMEEFLLLSADKLKRVLSFQDLYLGMEGESAVLNAVVKWLEFDTDDRITEFSDIMKLVRLKYVCRKVLKKFMDSAVVRENKVILETIQDQLAVEDSSPREAVRHLYVIGGYLQSRTGPQCPRLKSVERLDFNANRWESVERLPILASGVQVFELHSKLLCTAFEMIKFNYGIESEEEVELKGFYEYNYLTDGWKDAKDCFSEAALKCLHDCLQNSGAMSVCSQTNKIYTVTDQSVTCIHSEIDDGDLYCKTVEPLPPIENFILTGHANHVSLVYNGDLYVFGGEERISQSEVYPTSTVYCFDKNENFWKTKASMHEPRSRFAAVVLDNHIYAVGGFNTRRLRSVERYDPESDTWTYVTSMEKERSHLQAVVYNGKIYAVGGKSYSIRLGGARKVLNSCEVYDPETDTWTFTEPMKSARCLFGAAVY